MDIPQITPLSESSTGDMGQKYLATGKDVALRRWEEDAGNDFSAQTTRPYEIVGYILNGILELDLDGEMVRLSEGDSWLIPAGAPHRYRVVERLIAIEATSPPARFNERDDPA